MISQYFEWKKEPWLALFGRVHDPKVRKIILYESMADQQKAILDGIKKKQVCPLPQPPLIEILGLSAFFRYRIHPGSLSRVPTFLVYHKRFFVSSHVKLCICSLST